MQYFGSNIVESVAETWVEAEISWMKVDGAGWRWVHGLVIPFPKILRLLVFIQSSLFANNSRNKQN